MDSSDGEFRSVAEASPLPASMAPKLHLVKRHRSKLLFFPVITTISCLLLLFISRIFFFKIQVSNQISYVQLKVKYIYKCSPEAVFVEVVNRTVDVNGRTRVRWF